MAEPRPTVPRALRLLLLAALLLGIVTMHTLGHPAAGGHGVEHGTDHGPTRHAVSAGHPAGAGETVHTAAADGMDPMTACLAVLAGWTLLLLAAGPLLRHGGDAAAEVRARLLRAVRALPPPGGGRILLARLSVLRQ
ncbi:MULTISPECIES: DUF6153 family protein [unclassified Kitasatospora]|uniref:DUF6153 family protein n=1 Tax=unclassified Kitasatospora TaxID=2633591 RepID=UPI00381D9253